jgi:hypothetical protein
MSRDGNKETKKGSPTCHGGAFVLPKAHCGQFNEVEEAIPAPCFWNQGGHRIALRKTYAIRKLSVQFHASFPASTPKILKKFRGSGDTQASMTSVLRLEPEP